MSAAEFNLVDLKNPRMRTLHFAWFAFFMTFVLWFNHASLMVHIRDSLGLSREEVSAILTLNVALTIPARILVGMWVDRYGPRIVFTTLLVVSAFLCFGFALARDFETLALARAALGFVGAGFVVGIRLVSEWFPARQVGLAQGIYGGWGNFGSAAAAMTMPWLALQFGGEDGWRWAIATTGVMALLYAAVFYRSVRNTPKGSTYFKPSKTGGLEVTSRRDFYFYLIMSSPMYLALGVVAWKLSPANIGLFDAATTWIAYLLLVGLFVVQIHRVYTINRRVFISRVPTMYRYSFKQVAILDVSYFVTFGAELAMVSVLPLFFLETFEELSPMQAGFYAAIFPFVNLVARPAGGWISDRFSRRVSLSALIGGVALGYTMLSRIDGTWPMGATIAILLFCSMCGTAGSGAVFAMVPLVQRLMTGQIAGMAGAYGNVGGVVFLTVLSFMDYTSFFLVISASAVLCFVIFQFMDEPEGHIAEIREDGTVELIEVS